MRASVAHICPSFSFFIFTGFIKEMARRLRFCHSVSYAFCRRRQKATNSLKILRLERICVAVLTPRVALASCDGPLQAEGQSL